MTVEVGAGALLNLRHFAKALGHSRQTIYNQLAAGTCPVEPFRTSPYKWRRVDVDAYLRSLTDAG
jgi:predicted DNA-binding transcriptional regulator AlpA